MDSYGRLNFLQIYTKILIEKFLKTDEILEFYNIESLGIIRSKKRFTDGSRNFYLGIDTPNRY